MNDSGLRERKKIATREALSAAAFRLALERGLANVRVEDIAEAAGVSPRTYNNYFSSREAAIVAAVVTERASRIAAALRSRADEPLADAVVEAVVEQYSEPPSNDALLLITSAPALRAEFVEAVATIEPPLAQAIADHTGSTDDLATAVLAAAVSAAARVAVERWIRRPGKGMFVVPTGSLPDLLRAALDLEKPALAAFESRAEVAQPPQHTLE
jgi:AcrR family transcriptional regulator